jgi:hypothetical protein
MMHGIEPSISVRSLRFPVLVTGAPIDSLFPVVMAAAPANNANPIGPYPSLRAIREARAAQSEPLKARARFVNPATGEELMERKLLRACINKV